MGLAFECVNADRIRLSGRGGASWFRVAFLSTALSSPYLNPEFASRDVEGISAAWNERRPDGQSRPTRRPTVLFAGQPSNFPILHPRAFFLLLLRLLPSPSFLAPRPSLFFFAPLESMAGESNEVVVYRPTGNSNPSHPSPLNIKLTSNRIEEPRPSNFSFCRSGSQSHRRREVNFVAAAQGTRYFMDVVI